MSSLISIVAPAFNEESILREFHRRTAAILRTLPFDYEIVFVNDGSQDGTLAVSCAVKTVSDAAPMARLVMSSVSASAL